MYNNTMKVFAISDLHMSTNSNKPMDIFGANWVGYMEKIREDWQNKVSNDDIVLIGGDISWAMDLSEAKTDLDTIADLNGKKILIKGNHDFWWQHSVSRVRDILPKNFYSLQNDSIKFENVVICGSRCWSVPGAPDFSKQDEKIYLREAERLKLSFNSAKKLQQEGDKLIALIHYPPFTAKTESTLFTDLFEQNHVNAVVFGHLHGNKIKMNKYIEKNGIKYYLTSCDQVNNKLTEIIL